MRNIQAAERERTGITSLKVGYNRVFGYYIEITNANRHLIPDDYQRRQTLTGAERYVTPALKEYEEKVLTATEQIESAGAGALRTAACDDRRGDPPAARRRDAGGAARRARDARRGGGDANATFAPR